MTSWQTWVTALGSAGVLGAIVQLVRGWWDWRSGTSTRRVASARSAISAMGEAAKWAGLYYAYRSWCLTQHGPDDGYPEPHEGADGIDHP